MNIEKSYFTVQETLDRWPISEADLVYLAENGKLQLSVRVFNARISLPHDDDALGQYLALPQRITCYDGLLDLRPQDAFQVFRCGEAQLKTFYTPAKRYAVVCPDAPPIFVMIGDLVIRREERERVETEIGIPVENVSREAHDLAPLASYQDVVCNGRRYRLGPIQAEVVRLLHEALCAGTPWQNGKAVLAEAGSRSLHMAHLFKSQPNWQCLIRSDKRGNYMLAGPLSMGI